MLEGLIACVDVQHIYRGPPHVGDRGGVFGLPNGTHVAEADLALEYATSLDAWLTARGAVVYTNRPLEHVLVGPYSRRHRDAMALGCGIYLACHVNAGAGKDARIEYLAGTSSAALADKVARELARSVPYLSGGRTVPLVLGQRGAICIQGFTGGPAVILEPFFGDCAAHQPLMTSAGMAFLGGVLGQGVADWWLSGGSLEPRRAA